MNPIFIGGTGRSGTTILKRVLSSHSKVVSLPGELRVIVDPGGALDLISALSDDWSPYKADSAIQNFRDIMLACGRSRTGSFVYLEKIEKSLLGKVASMTPRRYLGVGLACYFGYDYYHRRLAQLMSELSYYLANGSWLGSSFRLRGKIYESEPRSRQEVEEIIRRFFIDLYSNISSLDEIYWLDDTPYNILHAGDLLTLFPNMRLIHIYRDPRDVLASYTRFKWGGDKLAATARRLAGIYHRWFQLRESLPPYCFLEIGLEELSNDPKTMLERICHFLDLEFEDRLMSIRLDQVNAGRWKNEIPGRERDAVEKWLGKYILAYRYEGAI